MDIFKIKEGILPGIISGIFLGIFLKVIELTTKINVYTLLLNVDYIPIINQVKFPEIIEFLFHLIISVLVAVFLVNFLKVRKWRPLKNFYFVIIFSLFISLILFPTTDLSERTPELTSIPALLYWLLGHILYGVLLGYLVKNKK